MKKLPVFALSVLLNYLNGTAQNDTKPIANPVVVHNERAVNAPVLDFSPAFYEDGIVFVSSRVPKGTEKMLDDNMGRQTMTIYTAKRGGDGRLMAPVPFAHELITQVHEGPMTFDKTGENIFFSRNFSTKKGAEYVKGISRMQIYAAKKEKGKWSEAVLLPFNEKESDACHPSISVDGNRLYFASNRAGGFGGMDIYYVERQGKSWGKPVNMGAAINSPKNDIFPFIHPDGTLFYSSNGKSGSKTDLDIYYTKPELNNKFSDPKSLGEPFNSDKDDFGFIVDLDLKNGYFTSSRSGGVGEDDIYAYSVTEGSLWDYLTFNKVAQNNSNGSSEPSTRNGETVPTSGGNPNSPKSSLPPTEDPNNLEEARQANSPNRLLDLIVIDKKTGEVIENAKVSSLNLNNLALSDVFTESSGASITPQTFETRGHNTFTDFNGKSTLKTNKKNTYLVNVAKEGYYSRQVRYKSDEVKNTIVVMLEQGTLTNAPTTEPSNTDILNSNLGNDVVFVLKNVYYNYNDASIRPDAHRDLKILFAAMKKYPDMTIELSSHTDCRGSDGYNVDLSQRRANSATNYLTSRGISPDRIKSVGFGEQKLVNNCMDGEPCSEAEHQRNRRTEVRILNAGTAEGKVSTQSRSLNER
jgi:outer membrane protein OmpA-like peptidoglycan-associated protein